eukprot:659741-Rhodomonas_salina.1
MDLAMDPGPKPLSLARAQEAHSEEIATLRSDHERHLEIQRLSHDQIGVWYAERGTELVRMVLPGHVAAEARAPGVQRAPLACYAHRARVYAGGERGAPVDLTVCLCVCVPLSLPPCLLPSLPLSLSSSLSGGARADAGGSAREGGGRAEGERGDGEEAERGAERGQGSTPPMVHALATRCPVLIYRIVLCAMHSTDSCMAMSVTVVGSYGGATRLLCAVRY